MKILKVLLAIGLVIIFVGLVIALGGIGCQQSEEQTDTPRYTSGAVCGMAKSQVEAELRQRRIDCPYCYYLGINRCSAYYQGNGLWMAEVTLSDGDKRTIYIDER